MSTIFCLSDLNLAIMESSYIDTEKLRPYINIKGRKGMIGEEIRKPLLAHSFMDLLIPETFSSNNIWNSVYLSDASNSFLIKLMNGISDGLSVHRKFLFEIASSGFRSSVNSEMLFLGELADKCMRFLEKYSTSPVYPDETFRLWEKETLSSRAAAEIREPLKSFLHEIETVCKEDAKQAEALAGMILIGLLSGLTEKESHLVLQYMQEYKRWHRDSFPRLVNSFWRLEKVADDLRLSSYCEIPHSPLPKDLIPILRFSGTEKTDSYYAADLSRISSYTDIIDTHKAHDLYDILNRHNSFSILAGAAGMGKKSILNLLMQKSQEKRDHIIAFCITPEVYNGNLIETIFSILQFPERSASLSSFSQYTGEWSFQVFIPDLHYFPQVDLLIQQMADLIRAVSSINNIRFFISCLSCPQRLEALSGGVYYCLPLNSSEKETILKTADPSINLDSLRSNPVLWKLLDIPVNIYYYAFGEPDHPHPGIRVPGFFLMNRAEHQKTPCRPDMLPL